MKSSVWFVSIFSHQLEIQICNFTVITTLATNERVRKKGTVGEIGLRIGKAKVDDMWGRLGARIVHTELHSAF